MAIKQKSKVYPRDIEENNPTKETLYDKVQKARTEYVWANKIPIEYLRPFENHPYKVIDNEEMQNLVDSINERGILTPLTVRKISGTEYEIISGHRRFYAAKKLGFEMIPAFIYELSYEEAVIAMVDANLQREHILPSEKAHAYKMKLEALKHQGQTSAQLGQKWSVEQVAEDSPDSRSQIQRYIRLTNLIPELLNLVDEERIAFTPAVELSYLNEVEQADLVEEIRVCDATPNLSQAQRLRAISREEGLTPEHIGEILAEEKANQKQTIKFSVEKLKTVAPKVKESDLENFVMKACEHYYRYLQRQRNRDAR
ncbi:MAG: ParB/RepB/Spo0J family partition protein [Ruminococcaceae bacterium]|nr:ParB/RepB/Spo0J family partition protein [Oscillospiraceae bacterium]